MSRHRRPGRGASGRATAPRSASPAAPKPPPSATQAARRRVAPPLTEDDRAAIADSPFTELGLEPALVRSLLDEGYETPSPVQTQVIPVVLGGRDVLACAQTGTGKTAAFVLPILQRLSHEPNPERRLRCLVITPTRELAAQIAERVEVYGQYLDLSHTVIYGGVGQRPQEDALRAGPDVLVACPGRLLDLIGQGFVRLADVTHLVLDEADRMLDMGFLPDVKRIVARVPAARTTLLLSATMPPDIEALGRSLLRDPVRVAIAPEITTAERVEQSLVYVAKSEKQALLQARLEDPAVFRALVFTRTKHGANRVTEKLERAGIAAAAIHGNKSQNARDRALAGFKAGKVRVLVATDVAARGIDVEHVTHVFNFDLPNEPEAYVHRIGRTGRAGAGGVAVSFCDHDERGYLADIERLIKKKIPATGQLSMVRDPTPSDDRPPRPQGRGRPGGGGGHGGGGGRTGGGGGRGGGGGGGRAQGGGGGGRGHGGGRGR